MSIGRGGDEPLVSVVVPTHNRCAAVKRCIAALLRQTYSNIEILICDDASTDHTCEAVTATGDDRVILLRGAVNSGAAAARNLGVARAAGEIVFFTDDDVEVAQDWVSRGLRYFEDADVVGLEGELTYVSHAWVRHYGDRVVENRSGGQYMTANAAYRRSALESAGGFDPRLRRHQDMQLALRMLDLGRIVFAPDVRACHARERYTAKTFMADVTKLDYLLDIDGGLDHARLGPFLFPLHLVVLAIPPLVLARLLAFRRWDARDLMLLALAYPRLLYERFVIWRWALRNKRLLL